MTVKTNKVQVGQNADALKNFTLMVPDVPDGSMEIRRGNADVPGALLVKINPDGGVDTNAPAFSATCNASTSLQVGTDVKVLFQVEEWDYGSCYDSATSKFQPKQAGVYFIYSLVVLGNTPARVYIYLHKNGLRHRTGSSASEAQFSGTIGASVYMNGTTDYVEVFASASVAQPSAGNSATIFQAHLVKASTQIVVGL